MHLSFLRNIKALPTADCDSIKKAKPGDASLRENKSPDILDDGKALRVILHRRGLVLRLRTLEKRKQAFSEVA